MNVPLCRALEGFKTVMIIGFNDNTWDRASEELDDLFVDYKRRQEPSRDVLYLSGPITDTSEAVVRLHDLLRRR